MRIVTLGTGGAIPTSARKLPSTAVQREGELLLFDCGEGTQMQLPKARLGLGRLSKVFISHLHGDHILGLPGLLLTLSQTSREGPVWIYGPPGVARLVGELSNFWNYRDRCEVEVIELGGGLVCEGPGYRVVAEPVDHSVFTLGYALIENPRPGKFLVEKAQTLGVPEGPFFGRLQSGEQVRLPNGRVVSPAQVLGPPRPGRKIAYTVDTRPCEASLRLAKEADLLVHDSMFGSELAEEAALRGHSTAVQAAEIAREAGVEELILTHISPRYQDASVLLKEARSIFRRSIVARDLMSLEIPVHK